MQLRRFLVLSIVLGAGTAMVVNRLWPAAEGRRCNVKHGICHVVFPGCGCLFHSSASWICGMSSFRRLFGVPFLFLFSLVLLARAQASIIERCLLFLLLSIERFYRFRLSLVWFCFLLLDYLVEPYMLVLLFW